MPPNRPNRPIVLATRGSALALAQAHYMRKCLQTLLPDWPIAIRIFKTTGDRLQSQPPAAIPSRLPKGLFTKELESALLDGQADLAVHSLKDLPTELPHGLKLAAVSPREDAREALLTKRPLAFAPDSNPLRALPPGTAIGTGSPRRQAFLLAAEPRLRPVPLRGNVPTRIRKLADSPHLDGIILAVAGLKRLGYSLPTNQAIQGNDAPPNLFATLLPVQYLVPCPAQGAIGLETRFNDPEIQPLCDLFNDEDTQICVTAERTFLQTMGGGCQSPLAAHAQLTKNTLRLLAAKPLSDGVKTLEGTTERNNGAALAKKLAVNLQTAPQK